MLKDRFLYLIGRLDEFSLQSRLFHAISLVICVTLLSRSVFFTFTSLQFAFVACGILGLMNAGYYYLSRFKGHTQLAVNLCALQLTATLVINYMFNAGIGGNMLLLAVATLFLVILFTPIRHRIFWLIVNMAVVFTMMALEYFDPSIVKQQYSNRTEMFIDLGTAYLTIALLITAGTYILRKSYDMQKRLAEDQARKLQVLNDEKDKLFSIISHDLNAPMASVKQYLDLMKMVDLDLEERALIEQDLSCSLKNAQYLLNNLLHWAKNQMRQKQVDLVNVEIKELLEETVSLFALRAAKKGISIRLDLTPELGVKGDLNMLKLVLRNIINNAIKFTNINGNVDISNRTEEGNCVIVVKDDGIGIQTDRQQSIFSLNVVSSYGTANEKGTGLGLMLCKEFIEQQHGKIWFDSIPWEGTSFYVSLPMVAVLKAQD